jgi:hypothetical protein
MNHWQKYNARWSLIQPPLRPNEDVIETFQSLIGSPSSHVLLLGVTPELADAFEHVYAFDKSPAMISDVWPGDSATKTATEGDWLNLGALNRAFSAVIGDGSLNMLAFPHDMKTLLDLAFDLLKQGGRFACRLFERPMVPVSESDLVNLASAPSGLNFHAFKWQLAMHLAEKTGANVPVEHVLQSFDQLFPDREQLSLRTGWPRRVIDTIDVYDGSPAVYSFPNRIEFLSVLPAGACGVEFIDCGTYDLARQCPILTFTKT